MHSDIAELTMEEIDQVSGGARTVFWGLVTNLVYDAAKGAGAWLNSNKGGGADEGTWELIGQSQMTA